MRVVVTGGAGFIGSNLARRLSARGTSVVVVDDLSTGRRENLDGLDLEFIEGSILDQAVLDAALLGSSAVVHLAALPSVPRSLADPVASHEVNATGTLRVLEAVRRHGRPHVIVASSSSVYGANPTLPKHEDLPTTPLSPYAVSKLAAENYALVYQVCFGLDTLVVRFFNVYGPYQAADHPYAAVIPKFVAAALMGQPLSINGSGEQSRDFTYIDTVVTAITSALERRTVCPGPVNLAFGSRVSLLDVVTELEAILGRPLARTHGPERPGDVRHSQADNSRLRSLLPDLEPVAMAPGLAATVRWYQAQATRARR